ncbi:MAG TPA: arginine--tRNA ligase, partial [Sinorhizobium sp.]|nr:arginine--tRNA ligase [Sinorhizobium sp.]
MNLFTDFESRIKNILESFDIVREKRSEIDFGRINIEPPRDASHGDVATNAAMVLAKSLGTNPRALADLIIEKLRQDPEVAEVSVAGPGFINVRLSVSYWQKILA